MTSGRARAAMAGGLALALAVLVAVAARGPSAGGEAHPETSPPPRVPVPVSPAPVAAAVTGAAPSAAPDRPETSPSSPQESEASLTERLRALVDVDPAAAVSLSEDGARRFPGGSLADERSFLKMRALVHLGRIGDARSEAEDLFERFPESPYGENAYRLTGVHPRPRPPSGRGEGR